jgi:hypothetical protein
VSGAGRGDALALGVVAATAFCLYLTTMPPGVTWWFGAADSGDLAAAAFVWGVPHPTGYPLLTALGWLATRVPVGEPAWRTNLLDAALAAAAAAVAGAAVISALRGLVRDEVARFAAVAAALSLATAGVVWSQAHVTEVYALNLLLITAVAWLTLRSVGGRPAPLLLGLAQGLALTAHLTAVFALVATVAAVAAAGRRPDRGALGRYAGGLALGLAVYLLLPLRAAMDPPYNWGDPDTPARFLRHVTGAGYGGFFAWSDPAGIARSALSLLRLLLGDIAPWTWIALAGAAWGWERPRTRPAVAFFGTLALLSWLFAAVYRAPDATTYLIPAYLGWAALAGIGLALGASLLMTTRPAAWRTPALAGGLAVALLTGVWTARAQLRHDLRGDATARVFAEAVLTPLPPGANVVVARDDAAFTLRYAQEALGIRPDVTVIDVRFPPGERLP